MTSIIEYDGHQMKKSTVVLVAILWLLGWVCPIANAQIAGGTVSGTVTDPSGAVIPAATVEIVNDHTGIKLAITTNAAGVYNAPGLDAGNYTITVTATGFKTLKLGLRLNVGGDIVANAQLQIGAETQVFVQAGVPLLDLGSAVLTSTVEGVQVRTLPLNGRDWTQLAALEPGVSSITSQVAIQSGNNSRGNRGWGQQMTIGGARPQQNSYHLDGIVVNDYSGNGPGGVLGLALGVDAIQEFSVVTGNAPAEYGRTSGGAINAVTRPGTNDLHGAVYEFLRNSALDARNYFDVGPEPPFKRNQYGGEIGGPIVKDHTFFFFDYEGLRQDLSSTDQITVPSATARTGNLSTGKVQVNSSVVPFLGIYPLPNQTLPGSTDLGLYNFVADSITSEDLYTARIDQTFSRADQFHVTFLRDSSTNVAPDSFDFTKVGLAVDRTDATVQESHTFGANIANAARVGFSRSVSLAPSSSTAINPLASDTSLGFEPNSTVGELRISGLTNFPGGVNAEGAYVYHYNSFQAYDDLYWTHGAHSLKFGPSVEYIQSNNVGRDTTGQFVFGSLKAFLTNSPSSFSAAVLGSDTPIYLRQWVIGAYAQDDWHVRPNLTVNLGLRYEMATVPTDIHGHIAVLPSYTSATPNLGNNYFSNPTVKDFEPRVGVSWDPTGKGTTAVRAAFGIYDTLPLTYMFDLLTLNTSPYAQNVSLAKPPKGSFPSGAYPLATSGVKNLRYSYVEQHPGRPYVMQYNLNVQHEFPGQITAEIGYQGVHGVRQPLRSNDSNIVLPTNPADLNQLVWPTPAGSGTRINPNVGTINTLVWNESTVYNALLARVSREVRSLVLGASYTWGRSIDESSSSIAGGNFTNSIQAEWPFATNLFRGPSDFNVPQNLSASLLWNLPSLRDKDNKWLSKSIDGWQFSTIYHGMSGLPYTPTIGGDPLGLLNANPFSLPDRLSGSSCGHPGQLHKVNFVPYDLNMSCFAFPADSKGALEPTRLGTSRRNIAYGPGLQELDGSLIKDTTFEAFSRQLAVQFRAEAFNVLNHTNFSSPTTTAAQVFNASGNALAGAGVVSSTSTTSRELQFALRFRF